MTKPWTLTPERILDDLIEGMGVAFKEAGKNAEASVTNTKREYYRGVQDGLLGTLATLTIMRHDKAICPKPEPSLGPITRAIVDRGRPPDPRMAIDGD